MNFRPESLPIAAVQRTGKRGASSLESQTSTEELIGKNVGNYMIESSLKRGGMGEVYIARHPALGRVAAVKFLNASISSPDLSARFLNEARITASLQHPNIIDIFDFGNLNGRFYYVMELLVGQDLDEEMSGNVRLPLPTIIEYLEQICNGLEAAHQLGIVHRDLKPANIFVLDGYPLTIKLMDFGIAKILATENAKTNHGQILGTPAYMAPEQALGEVSQISAQTDIYALGVIAYEMLAGRRPFEHTAPMMQLVAHIHENVPPLSETAPHVPPSLAQVIESCLAKSPQMRPSSAQILNQQIVNSLRASAPYSVRRQESTESAPRAPIVHISPSLSSPIDTDPHERPVGLDNTDRNVLKKLLQRIRRKGDLPAFVANVGDVNKKADFGGKYSAAQLSDAILKDHALTAKLLRVVNTSYLQRFGGRVCSVRQAIVILGFEQVRSIAMSIAVFDRANAGPNASRIADSSVHSLVSGEIAKELCQLCDVKDIEQAMICSMFCNLGRHLALVYLPEQYDNAVARAQRENIPLERAAEKELGISFQKLAIGVAEQWHLPGQLLQSMTLVPSKGATLVSDQQKIAALAQLSNNLSELVAEGLTGPTDPRLKKLLLQHENLIILNPEKISGLVTHAEESFRLRYAQLLGKSSRGSKVLQETTELPPSGAVAMPTSTKLEGTNAAGDLIAGNSKKTKTLEKNIAVPRVIQRLHLGQTSPLTSLEEIRTALAHQDRRHHAWELALGEIASRLSLPRLVALRANDNGTELIASHAIGQDAQSVASALRFQLNPSPTNPDVFSRAYHLKKDVVVKDSFSEKSTTQIPSRYFEVLGSPAFAVLVCSAGEKPPTLLLADVEDPNNLPSRPQMNSIDELKKLLAQAVA